MLFDDVDCSMLLIRVPPEQTLLRVNAGRWQPAIRMDAFWSWRFGGVAKVGCP